MTSEKKSYVYMITCIPMTCVYIGKSIDPEGRFKAHLSESKKTRSAHLPLYRAIRKYGHEAFELSIVQVCDSEQQAYDAERSWILKLREDGRALFNRSAGGMGNFSPTDDTRERMSKAQKGKVITEEQRLKISETLKGRKLPRDVVEKVAARLRGRKLSGVALENVKKSAEKRSKDPQWIERNREALNENRKLSQTPECREKIGKTQRLYTDDQALKLSEDYANGSSITDLLQKYEISIGTLYRMIKRANTLTGSRKSLRRGSKE